MLRKTGVLFLLLSILSGCTHSPESLFPRHYDKTKVLWPVIQHQFVSYFSSIKVTGEVDVTLHSGYRRPEVVLYGDPRDLAHVHTSVTNSKLEIVVDTLFPKYGPLHAEIKADEIDGFVFYGKGKLYAPKLRTRDLVAHIDNAGPTQFKGQVGVSRLSIDGSGPVYIDGLYSNNLKLTLSKQAKAKFRGVVRTSELYLKGNAWLSMYWLQSKFIKIRAQDDAFVQLAGDVETLDACLVDNAQYNGRYLRAQVAFVKTSDESIAKVNAVKRQHTFAMGHSDLYYYNLPVYKSDFMASAGSVLDMRNWEFSKLQPYTQYNKP